MAAKSSTMLELGTPAPSFSLPATDDRTVSLEDFREAPALVVMFICNHCPFVRHVRAELTRLAHDYAEQAVALVAISSNDVEQYPQDGLQGMRAEKEAAGYPFPYLYDGSQEVAKAYRAACTPDFFVFDADRCLAYRGQLDDSRPGNDVPVTGRDLRAALDAVLRGEPAPTPQKPSVGCGIKWRPGNEPDYS